MKKLLIILTILTPALILQSGCSSIEPDCDFDLSQTEWSLARLNDGRYAGVNTRHKYVIEAQSGDKVIGEDSCYVKGWMKLFWENDLDNHLDTIYSK